MRKVYVEVLVRLIVCANDDAEIGEVLDEMDCNFSDTTGKADIVDPEIMNYEIKDSK